MNFGFGITSGAERGFSSSPPTFKNGRAFASRQIEKALVKSMALMSKAPFAGKNRRILWLCILFIATFADDLVLNKSTRRLYLVTAQFIRVNVSIVYDLIDMIVIN